MDFTEPDFRAVEREREDRQEADLYSPDDDPENEGYLEEIREAAASHEGEDPEAAAHRRAVKIAWARRSR